MLCLEIELLTGRYVATAYNDRRTAEWPPHPARVYSALVATWGEADKPPAEREALLWLERQGPPAVTASEAAVREIVTVFVPVNDTTVAKDVHDLTEDLVEAEAELATAGQVVEVAADAKTQRAATKAADQAARRVATLGERLVRALGPDGKDSADGIRAAAHLLPDQRGRQPRTFPSVAPEVGFVYLTWRSAEPSDDLRETLRGLARRIVRIGHSSSLVRCSFVDQAPEPTWVPDPEGPEPLRVVKPGQLELLEEEHRKQSAGARPCGFQRYRRAGAPVADEPTRSVFGSNDWIVLRRIEGPSLPSTRAADVAAAVRGALMKHASQPPRPIISGHAEDGGPGDAPHLAIVSLPFVGSDHSDGRILGVALVLPRRLSAEDRQHVFHAIGGWERSRRFDDEETPALELMLGAAGKLVVERLREETGAALNLKSETWCTPSRRWVSVTPVALDRNPGKLRSKDPDPKRRAQTEARAMAEAAQTIAASCERIGLPEPESVTILPSVSLTGTSKAVRFPPFPGDRSRTQRVKVHAELVFSRPLMGPVLLGAGRYQGLGLFRPIEEEA